jgi:ElaB/YqjD/DUF883 family membrane-anchored ribosome-binding protein
MNNTNHEDELDLRKELTELKNTVAELAQAYIQNMGDKLGDIPAYVKESEEQVVQSMKKHPLACVGTAALVGFLLGAVLTRR